LPGVGILVEAINHSQYETAGLTAVLKSGFGENANKRIFGETHDWSSRRLVRAGVTLTSSTGHPYFVSNYNRPLHENGRQQFLISEIPLGLALLTVFLYSRIRILSSGE